jgi:hypothetical protein
MCAIFSRGLTVSGQPGNRIPTPLVGFQVFEDRKTLLQPFERTSFAPFRCPLVERNPLQSGMLSLKQCFRLSISLSRYVLILILRRFP